MRARRLRGITNPPLFPADLWGRPQGPVRVSDPADELVWFGVREQRSELSTDILVGVPATHSIEEKKHRVDIAFIRTRVIDLSNGTYPPLRSAR